jgi:glycerol-3-phosphate dehydrogenase
MLDVHLPHKGIHGFWEFFIHLFTITVGLLIATQIESCMEWRHHVHVAEEDPDVSVLICAIGGGINGIGLLQRAGAAGNRCPAGREVRFLRRNQRRHDAVIHGGLRYLENAEFRLVRESLRERNRLLRNAPHYVKPLPTTIPIFNWTSGMVPAIRNLLGWPAKPGDRGALLIKTGLTLYDFLAGREVPAAPPPVPLPARGARAAALPEPRGHLHRDLLRRAITYPERLCLELVQDAEAALPGAHALNYVRLQSAAGGAVVLRDEVSGETCEVRPRSSSTPPARGSTGPIATSGASPVHRRNQGLPHRARPPRTGGGDRGRDDLLRQPRRPHLHLLRRSRARSSPAPPTSHQDPEASATRLEVDYILESMRQAFPAIRVDRSHVVFRFCGVRPLPRSNALTPGQISRDHSFPVLAPGNGGRLPHLLAGRREVDHLPRAGRAGGRTRFCASWASRECASSADLPIGGGKGYPRLPEGTGLPQAAASRSRNAMAPARTESPPICGRAPMRRSPATPATPAGRSSSSRAASGSSTSTTDPEANAHGPARRGEPAFARRTGRHRLAGAPVVATGEAAAEVERTVQLLESSRRDAGQVIEVALQVLVDVAIHTVDRVYLS